MAAWSPNNGCGPGRARGLWRGRTARGTRGRQVARCQARLPSRSPPPRAGTCRRTRQHPHILTTDQSDT
eukprot:4948123-Pyramimonas_sp.AAC.1